MGNKAGDFHVDRDYVPRARSYFESMARSLNNPLAELSFARITAERDISPEPHSDDLTLTPDGTGATNIVQRVINDEQLPSELVEDALRMDLNRILRPDANFTRIAVQRTDGDKWMLYLDERAKGRVSLAESGSGLKTILLVLIRMVVLPALERKEPVDYVFAFEELENNLHPGLQRRLMKYVQEKLAEMAAVAFVTTHAPAVIDLLSRTDDAQILHVVHDGEMARVRVVGGSAAGHAVLDDLDVKASDLLQANGIVWVEGISDVIYLRRWIELYCKAKEVSPPVEGSEYAFMEYGGRCLKHLDFSAADIENLAAEDAKWLLPALSISRNTYVIMDSDRKNSESKVNKTKLRAAAAAGGCWISEGREVENYLPPQVAQAIFGRTLGQYDSAASVCREEKNTRLDKKKAAARAASMLTSENWRQRDLEAEIDKLFKAISGWNPVYSEGEHS